MKKLNKNKVWAWAWLLLAIGWIIKGFVMNWTFEIFIGLITAILVSSLNFEIVSLKNKLKLSNGGK